MPYLKLEAHSIQRKRLAVDLHYFGHTRDHNMLQVKIHLGLRLTDSNHGMRHVGYTIKKLHMPALGSNADLNSPAAKHSSTCRFAPYTTWTYSWP